MSSAKDRKQLKALLAQPPRSANLPAVAEHPDCPPLDTAMLTAEIVLSPSFQMPKPHPRSPLTPTRPAEQPSGPRVTLHHHGGFRDVRHGVKRIKHHAELLVLSGDGWQLLMPLANLSYMEVEENR